ncbi:methyltransferase domain-containing protein [Fulvivirgaceae bacterium PWU4]|uniref:Methyltransferase domain-containing protein n=1 Tax=Chryseosolibacter histidini TaxID=2782349 RepID=A0AAP2GN35_9BACT|nr:class I SAM-dependent methyltransferase [Chryseosolibacter histidini]MBT1696490.1 methyltransferase domain-containing protein [Chryseosolibacter histidini]
MADLNVLRNKIKAKTDALWILQKNRVKKFFRQFYADQHQLTSVTSADRYPELFEEAKKALKGLPSDEIKLLSFGCSTGEECFSLRKYFPQGFIVGADINKSNLKKASDKNTDPWIKFILSNDANLAAEGKYHAIFCLSVLCRWEDTKDVENCEAIYPFEKFEKTVSSLTNLLAPNGILVIYNSNFRFEDSEISSQFEIVSTPSVKNSGFVHKFDASNRKVHQQHKHCIYRKVTKVASAYAS